MALCVLTDLLLGYTSEPCLMQWGCRNLKASPLVTKFKFLAESLGSSCLCLTLGCGVWSSASVTLLSSSPGLTLLHSCPSASSPSCSQSGMPFLHLLCLESSYAYLRPRIKGHLPFFFLKTLQILLPHLLLLCCIVFWLCHNYCTDHI